MYELIRRIGDGEMPIDALSDGGSKSSAGPWGRAIAPWGKLMFDHQRAVGLEWMNQAVAIARRPPAERGALWTAWEGSITRAKQSYQGILGAALPLLLAPAVKSSSSAQNRYLSSLATTAILLGIERHRRKTGTWPPAISAIDRAILPDPPVDPYSGESFRMERRGGRILVFSIGPNGIDEHGAYDPKRWGKGDSDDVGGSVWDVVLRRRTPAPSAR
jgi:hypothetical protein